MQIYATYKWGTSNKLILRKVYVTFFKDMVIIKDFDVKLLTIDKQSYTTLVFTKLDTIQLKNMMIMEVLIA